MRFLGVGKSRMHRTGKRFRGLDERTLNQGFLIATSSLWPWFDVHLLYFLDVLVCTVSCSWPRCSTTSQSNLFLSYILLSSLLDSWWEHAQQAAQMHLTSRKNPLDFSCDYKFLRFETAESKSKNSDELREELLVKLLDRMLLGPTHQVLDMKPTELPLRELPPGNVSSLFLMYLAYVRPSGQQPACKSTFYNAWKFWTPCLRFRHASEHTMCLQCQTLKAAIRASTDSRLQYVF